MRYKNKTHQRIFEEQVNRNPCRCSNEYLAALYLLTADREQWNAAKRVIGRKKIDFAQIRTKKFTTNGYTVFIVAKDIYDGETHITLKDICDRYLVSDKQFDLFVTAIHICRLGYPYTGITKVFN
jgi:hypothetical protein